MRRTRNRVVVLLCLGALLGTGGAAAVALHRASRCDVRAPADRAARAGLYPNGAEIRLLLAHALMR